MNERYPPGYDQPPAAQNQPPVGRLVVCRHESRLPRLMLARRTEIGQPCRHDQHQPTPDCHRNQFLDDSVAVAEKAKLELGGYGWHDNDNWQRYFCWLSCGWGEADPDCYRVEAGDEARRPEYLLAQARVNAAIESFGVHINRFSRTFIDYLENYDRYNPDNPAGGIDEILGRLYGPSLQLADAYRCRQAISSLKHFFGMYEWAEPRVREMGRYHQEQLVVASGWGQIQWAGQHSHGGCGCTDVGRPVPGYRYRALVGPKTDGQ